MGLKELLIEREGKSLQTIKRPALWESSSTKTSWQHSELMERGQISESKFQERKRRRHSKRGVPPSIPYCNKSGPFGGKKRKGVVDGLSREEGKAILYLLRKERSCLG